MRHGEIYADEFGWDRDFEGLVARIVADYQASARPGRDAAWVAEVDGARAGCVFCVERDAETAQLRILLVEPWARGLGLGRALVTRCVSLRARGRVREDRAVDQRRAGVGAADLRGGGVREPWRRRRTAASGAELVGQNWALSLSDG
ncbi:MAG: GNAT family N-acetyltransferase [Myxococcota bacterium]